MSNKVNYEKAVEVAKAALFAKEQKIPPFNRNQLFPDAIIPENIEEGSKEHALFLFHSVSIDSMRQAKQVYKAMREIKKRGSLRELAETKRKELEDLLIPYFGDTVKDSKKSITDPVGTLIYNARKLEEECDGNPPDLKARDVKNTLARITEFRQYRISKAALLMKNYTRLGIWHFSPTEIPIKVDRHVTRISLGCGVVNIKEYAEQLKKSKAKALQKAIEDQIKRQFFTQEDVDKGKIRIVRADKLISPLTEVYLEVTQRERISSIDLDDTLWAIGAYSCKKNNAIYCRLDCPVQCETRPPSDNNAVWFFIDFDKRKNLNQLHLDFKKEYRLH